MAREKRSANDDLVVRGSLITLKRRCGKPTCHCAHGEPHATPALSYSVGGRTRMLTLREEDVPTVEAALARYHRACAELDRQALHGLGALRAHIAHRKAGGRARPR